MSIEQTNVIDFVGIEYATGRASLAISDHLNWDEDEGEHLLKLQEKLNSYLAFIESGEMAQKFPETHGRSVIIKLMGKFPLSHEATKFFRLAKDAIEKAGFALEFQLVNE
jgi:hypothetical protein